MARGMSRSTTLSLLLWLCSVIAWLLLHFRGACTQITCWLPMGALVWLLGAGTLAALTADGNDPDAKALTREEVMERLRDKRREARTKTHKE
mmetsp:Transcript_58359/g.143163  ORF Transcript_58359/g.143163 Transcript_58359/m.143163 type:complete len:92 (+) Transcript_58359:178-453(+)|eukprot:CAMPEP_0206250424 /NCGR_PEP_ID=MMETSP0047_2-20121206/21462_1 /ASSEMBLY_ACC=CAM_ASM_000192 /TAXON_ID=195065 /ORGANISM="Chroomonas mesostigmatica_cf, Strain CCMP1168" /LENGTH=91 /DNA_ID=CAMNT_0053676267 /DNA_START=178 /DNA_END=453 /DNA_ORIENTATION=+